MDDLPKSDLFRSSTERLGLPVEQSLHVPQILEEEVHPAPARGLACLGVNVKVEKTTTHRGVVDEPVEMPRTRAALDLDFIPALSTFCKALDRSEMAVRRVLPNVSLADLPLNGVTGIDAPGFERAHASY